MTAKEMILKRLGESEEPLPVHKLGIVGYSENNLATRLSELQREGKVVGTFPGHRPYKVWALAKGQGELFT